MSGCLRVPAILVVLCAGCGGGSDPSPPAAPVIPDPAPTPAPPPLDYAGVWVGSMPYQGLSQQTLCRITSAGAFPNQVTCFLYQGRDIVAAFLGQYGTLTATSPNQFAASGMVHDSGAAAKPFTLDSGEVTSTSLTLNFTVAGSATTFVGTPATPPSGSVQGVYTSAYMRGDVSFTVTGNSAIVFGQGAGCTINGATNQLSHFGLVIQFDLSNCGVPNGLYDGFGVLSSSFVVPRANEAVMVAFAVVNGSRWIGGHALR